MTSSFSPLAGRARARDVEQLQGSVSQANVADPLAFALSNYMQMLANFTSPYDWRDIPGSVQT